MTTVALPSPERLRELFDYSPLSGELVWRKGRRAGRTAGYDQGRGYKRVKVDGVLYHAHRLVWKWLHGVDLSGYIHHDRIDKGNQAWSLHDVSPRENCSIEKTAASGLPAGVHFFFRWQVCSQVGYQRQANLSRSVPYRRRGRASLPIKITGGNVLTAVVPTEDGMGYVVVVDNRRAFASSHHLIPDKVAQLNRLNKIEDLVELNTSIKGDSQ